MLGSPLLINFALGSEMTKAEDLQEGQTVNEMHHRLIYANVDL
jgi:hypothetical protein